MVEGVQDLTKHSTKKLYWTNRDAVCLSTEKIQQNRMQADNRAGFSLAAKHSCQELQLQAVV